MPKGKKNKIYNEKSRLINKELNARLDKFRKVEKLDSLTLDELNGLHTELNGNVSVGNISLSLQEVQQKYTNATPSGYSHAMKAIKSTIEKKEQPDKEIQQSMESKEVNEKLSHSEKTPMKNSILARYSSDLKLIDLLAMEIWARRFAYKNIKNEVRNGLCPCLIEHAKLNNVVRNIEVDNKIYSISEAIETVENSDLMSSIMTLDQVKEIYDRMKSLEESMKAIELFKQKATGILEKFKCAIEQGPFVKGETKRAAERLLDKLQRKVNSTLGDNALEDAINQFKGEVLQSIGGVLPKFKDDLPWFTYLNNMLKEMANIAVSRVTLGRYQGFFTLTKSKASEHVEQLRSDLYESKSKVEPEQEDSNDNEENNPNISTVAPKS